MEKVTIFGRMTCGFCVRAVRLCEARGIELKWVDMMEENITKEDIAQKIGKPVHTVPQIFVGEQHIGGYDEFAAFLSQQETAAH